MEAFLRGIEFEKQGKPVDAVVAFRETLQDDPQMAARMGPSWRDAPDYWANTGIH